MGFTRKYRPSNCIYIKLQIERIVISKGKFGELCSQNWEEWVITIENSWELTELNAIFLSYDFDPSRFGTASSLWRGTSETEKTDVWTT